MYIYQTAHGQELLFPMAVLLAVNNFNSIIALALVGKDRSDQTGIDNFMVQQLDGTQNEWGWCKQKIVANAILTVSLAVCKAGAAAKNLPLYNHIANLAGNKKLVLPVPAFNVISGGSHARNKLAMQEKLSAWQLGNEPSKFQPTICPLDFFFKEGETLYHHEQNTVLDIPDHNLSFGM